MTLGISPLNHSAQRSLVDARRIQKRIRMSGCLYRSLDSQTRGNTCYPGPADSDLLEFFSRGPVLFQIWKKQNKSHAVRLELLKVFLIFESLSSPMLPALFVSAQSGSLLGAGERKTAFGHSNAPMLHVSKFYHLRRQILFFLSQNDQRLLFFLSELISFEELKYSLELFQRFHSKVSHSLHPRRERTCQKVLEDHYQLWTTFPSHLVLSGDLPQQEEAERKLNPKKKAFSAKAEKLRRSPEVCCSLLQSQGFFPTFWTARNPKQHVVVVFFPKTVYAPGPERPMLSYTCSRAELCFWWFFCEKRWYMFHVFHIEEHQYHVLRKFPAVFHFVMVSSYHPTHELPSPAARL